MEIKSPRWRIVNRPLVLLLWLCTLPPLPAASVKAPASTEVVIIGAGLSGLAAAYELKQAHVPYHILELAPRAGGRVRTVVYRRPGQPEIRADSGMEEYWESNPAVKFIKALKLPHLTDVAVSSIVISNTLYPLLEVSEPLAFQKKIFSSTEFEALEKFKAKAASLIQKLHTDEPLAPELLKLKDISFADYVRKELPPKPAEWIRISIECEIATAWDRISALDGLAEFHIFLGEGEQCYRITGGNDKFTEALADFAGRSHISLNHRVTRVVSRGPGDIQVHYLQTERNQNGIIKSKNVICTIPLFRLFEVQFVPPLSERKAEAIQSMSWGSYFKAHIFLPEKSKRFWTTNDDSILPILSDSELGVIYDGNPAQEGPTKILSLLIYGDNAEAFNLSSLDSVRARITEGLEKMWPGISKEIQDMEFYRYHPRAIAAWPVGRSRFDDFSGAIRAPENGVYLAGDFTESSHSDGAFISAHRAVKAILNGRAKSSGGPK